MIARFRAAANCRVSRVRRSDHVNAGKPLSDFFTLSEVVSASSLTLE